MKQTIYFRQEENNLQYYMNQEKLNEIELKEEPIIKVIEEKLKTTEHSDYLQIMVKGNIFNIAWEELKPIDRTPFSCDSYTTLIHSVKTKNNKEAIPRRKLIGALKILVVGCTPDNLPNLNIQAEFTKINSALRDLQQRGIVEFKKEYVTDFNNLVTLVQNEKPDIFHFVGHTVKNGNGEYELALKSGNIGLAKGVTHEQLSGLLINNNVQFSFLNACDSSIIAYRLAKEGLATIGMRKEIQDKSSKIFSEALYSSLVNGDTIDIAINKARHSLYLNNKENQNWSYPQLYISNDETLGFAIEPVLVPMSEVEIDCNNTKHVKVFIDDKQIGLTPVKTKIRIDYPIEIRMEKEGYKSSSEKFIATNPKEFFSRELDPILGTLVVETHPKVANIGVKCQRIDNPKEHKYEMTNALGQAIFNNIPVGEYEVYTSYEVKGTKVNIEEKSQSEPLELKFPIEMHLSHGMAELGTYILKWLRKPTTIIIGLLFLLLTIGTFLFINQSDKAEKAPEGMVEIKGTKKYTFLGMDISKENTPQLKGESDYEYQERLKLSQLMIDEIRSAESATQVQRYWGDEPRTYRLKNDFYIDKTEVTVGQYAIFLHALETNSSLIVQYQHPLDKNKKELKNWQKEKDTYLRARKQMTISQAKKAIESLEKAPSFKQYELEQKIDNSSFNKKNIEDFVPKDWHNQLKCQNCPVVNIDYFMAWAYAKFVGKRIPTDIEWEVASRGKDGRIFPWGNKFETWRYNGYISKYTKPTTVANSKFKDGWTPNDIADMTGNVDEWVLLRETKYGIDVGLKGGSVNSRGILFVLNYGTFIVNNPNKISKTTGFRCVSNNNLDKKNMIFIEKGDYKIGGINNYYFDLIRKLKAYNGQYKQRLVGEKPLSIPTNQIKYFKNGLKDFWIDTHEVTVGEYADFIDKMQNNSNFKNHILKLTKLGTLPLTPEKWDKQIKDQDKPVGAVSWFMATAYCVSQDKRLPTIFEYEYLIGGANQYTYPYGEQYFNSQKIRSNFKRGKNGMNLADIGQGKLFNASDERFKNSLGIYHLIGNVAEWANDPRYMTGESAYLKGGDFKIHGDIGANRFFKYLLNKQNYSNEEVGFRCAKDK